VIKNCTLVGRRFASIGIGSETSAGVRDVRIEDCSFNSRTHAIYIKTRIGRAGVTEGITGHSLDVLGGGFLRINLIRGGNTNTADDPVDGLVGYPTARDLRFSNVRLHDATVLVEATQIAPEKPVEGLSLRNVRGTCRKGISLANVNDVGLHDIQITGYEGAMLSYTNVTGPGLEALSR